MSLSAGFTLSFLLRVLRMSFLERELVLGPSHIDTGSPRRKLNKSKKEKCPFSCGQEIQREGMEGQQIEEQEVLSIPTPSKQLAWCGGENC